MKNWLVLLITCCILSACNTDAPKPPKDPLAPGAPDTTALTSNLKLATLSTTDLPALRRFFVEGWGMQLEGPLSMPLVLQQQQRQLWGIADSVDYDLYLLHRPSVPELIRLRILHLKTPMPHIHSSYSSRELGPFSLGFPNGDQAKADAHLRSLGYESMAAMQEGTIPRPDGSSYRYLETIYQGPDFLHVVGIERKDGMHQLAPIDSATMLGGPGYSAMVLDDSDKMMSFLTEVLDQELRADRHWKSSPGSALGIGEGVPFRFSLVYAKGMAHNHLLFLDYEDDIFTPTNAAPRVPNQGLGMWSFQARDLEAIYKRAEVFGSTIIQPPTTYLSPIVGEVDVMTLLAPNGFLIELFTPKNESAMRQFSTNGLDKISEVLCGVFDNHRQVVEEQAAGQQVHPLAKHVTGLITDRVANLPPDFNGIFILEESYYDYPDKPTDVKPYIFLFEPVGQGSVRLSSMQLPEGWDPKDVTNANAAFTLDFNTLQASAKFQPAIYQRIDEETFKVNAPNDLGNGMRFTLIETLTKDRLEVMELLEKDGQRLTPYDTPIIYERVD